jgi:hypothetical protein
MSRNKIIVLLYHCHNLKIFCISRKQAEEGPTWILTDHAQTDTSKISYNCEIGFKIFLGITLLVT